MPPAESNAWLPRLGGRLSDPQAGLPRRRQQCRPMPHCRPSTASNVSLDRVENHPSPSPLPAVRRACQPQPNARHIGLLHHAAEGASRVFKHNEVVSSTIPPGISSRSQSNQSLNFGLLVRGVEVEMKPTPAAWTPIATLE